MHQRCLHNHFTPIFPCFPLPSGTWQTPGLSIFWCCLPTSSSVCFVFFPSSLCRARWFWPDLMDRQWAGPLDLHERESDAPALHECHSYGWNSSTYMASLCRCPHSLKTRVRLSEEFHDKLNGLVFDLERDGIRQVVSCLSHCHKHWNTPPRQLSQTHTTHTYKHSGVLLSPSSSSGGIPSA